VAKLTFFEMLDNKKLRIHEWQRLTNFPLMATVDLSTGEIPFKTYVDPNGKFETKSYRQ
jgi:hypothetical protein